MAKQSKNDEILIRNEAAKLLKIHDRTLDYLVATNQIPYSRVGRRGVRFLKSRLLEWMREERENVEYRLNRGDK